MRHFNISVPPVIFPIKDFSRKTLNDVGFDLRRKGITTSKSEIPNSFHAVWNVDTREGITIAKSTFPDGCHISWYINALEGITVYVFTTDYYSIFYR